MKNFKTFWKIRENLNEAKKVDPEIFGNKDKFLSAASKFKSTVDFGSMLTSKSYENWWNETQGGVSPDGDWWMGEGKFDSVANKTAKLKPFGLTHIFAFKDPNRNPGSYHSEWIESVRFSGKNDKIALGLAKYLGPQDEKYVWGSTEISDSYGKGSAYGSLVLGPDKPNSYANELIKKYGTVKLAPSKKLEWKDLDENDQVSDVRDQIAIIKV